MQVLRPSKRKDDVVLAITTTGTVKVWTLLGNENKYSDPIYENESKQVMIPLKRNSSLSFSLSQTHWLHSPDFHSTDSMSECYHNELLCSKSAYSFDCMRQILANIWCWRFHCFVQCYFTVRWTLAGRRFSGSWPGYSVVRRGKGLPISFASKVS